MTTAEIRQIVDRVVSASPGWTVRPMTARRLIRSKVSHDRALRRKTLQVLRPSARVLESILRLFDERDWSGMATYLGGE